MRVATSLTWVASTLVIAPSLFRAFDGRAARRRLGGTPTSDRTAGRDAHDRRSDIGASPSRADQCDAVARAIRSGRSVDAAITRVLDPRDEVWTPLHRLLGAGHSLVDSLVRVRSTTTVPDDSSFLDLVSLCISGTSFDPVALESLAGVLREREEMSRDVEAATAQARLTVSILSVLPVGALALLWWSGSLDMRPGVVVSVAIGLALNLGGRAWTRALVRRVRRRALEGSLAHVFDVLVVSIRAGIGVDGAVAACARMTGEAAAIEASRRLRAGETLVEALDPIVRRHGSAGRALVDVVMSMERDGLPVVDALARLGSESRSLRRHAVDEATRRLPSLVAFPVVLCVLPSFLLVTVVPLVASSLIALGPVVGAHTP